MDFVEVGVQRAEPVPVVEHNSATEVFMYVAVSATPDVQPRLGFHVLSNQFRNALAHFPKN